MSTLNNRTGLISGCRHSRKLLLKTALMTCHAPHATHHAPRLVYIVFFSLCIVDFNRYFWQKPLCVERNLGIKKNWKGGERWEGERVEERFLPLPIVPPPFLFFDYCYFYWNTQREPLQRREQLPDDNRDDCFARSMTFWVAKHIQDHSSVYFLLLFNCYSRWSTTRYILFLCMSFFCYVLSYRWIVIIIVIVFLWILHWPLLKVTKTPGGVLEKFLGGDVPLGPWNP